MSKTPDKKKVIASIERLALKSADDSKYVTMREGERPKKSARVIADGKPGTAMGSEKMSAPDYGGTMKDHQVIDVKHPEGTTTNVSGIAVPVAPTGGFQRHYDSSNVKVHMDDLVCPK